MKELIGNFAALPNAIQVFSVVILGILICLGRSAWFRLFYRRGWYPKHREAFHLPPIVVIMFTAGVMFAVSEPLVWLFVLSTVIFFHLFDAPIMKAHLEKLEQQL